MRQTFRLIIFDLDGTLVDSQRDLAAAVNFTRSRSHLPPLELPQIRASVGDGIRVLLERTLPPCAGTGEYDAQVRTFRDYYGRHLLDSTVLYPGIRETLRTLSGSTKAVLTNKNESFSRSILEGLGIAGEFAVIRGGDSGTRRKPDPEPVTAIMERCHCEPGETALVGDGRNDVLAARAAGAAAVAVGYGYTDPGKLLSFKPDYFAPTTDELARLLALHTTETLR